MISGSLIFQAAFINQPQFKGKIIMNDKWHIHRYLTLEKFQWLLQDNGIFLAAASKQSDKLEGIYDSDSIVELITHSPQIKKISKDNWNELDNKFKTMMKDSMNRNRDYNFISSWFIGQEESQTMWNTYAQDGVIILTNCCALSLILSKCPVREAIQFREVEYNDNEKQKNINNPLFVKHEKFQYEKEYRIVFDKNVFDLCLGNGEVEVYQGEEKFHKIYAQQINVAVEKLQEQEKDFFYEKQDENGNLLGIILRYDLNSLISEIRLHPNATQKELEKIQKLSKKYGLNCNVILSKLDCK